MGKVWTKVAMPGIATKAQSVESRIKPIFSDFREISYHVVAIQGEQLCAAADGVDLV
jgi:hypothetical protein